MSSRSENEDDPEVYESSGEEWNSSSSEQPAAAAAAGGGTKKRNSKRTPARANKKQKVSEEEEEEDEEEEEVEDEEEEDSSEEESEEEDDEDEEGNKKNGVNKKQAKLEKSLKINTKSFSTGSFVILKKDAQMGDPKKPPVIWRIDGKALLQKYEPFEEEGKVRHKTTSVYTGWSSLDKDMYAPVTVKAASVQSNQTLIVDLDWDKLKEINQDSE